MTRLRLAALAVLMLAAGTAHAQLPSSYATATVLPVNAHVFGVYVPISSNAVGALAQLRLSFLPNVDFGFQGGISRLDRSAGERTLLRMGTDVRFVLSPATETQPYAMAVGGALGIFAGDDFNQLAIGPTFVVSRVVNPGYTPELTPYAGLGLAISSVNAGDVDDNDLYLPFRLGAELGLSPTARIVAEFSTKLGADFGDRNEWAIGANVPF